MVGRGFSIAFRVRDEIRPKGPKNTLFSILRPVFVF